MRITRRLEFDAGHRIPAHDNLCRHMHGHRYAIEVTLSGEPIRVPGAVNEAMVMDFSEIKAITAERVVDRWDHAFLAHRADLPVLAFLASLPGHRTVEFDAPPTAEHLAMVAFRLLDPAFRDRYGNHLVLERVRLYETPNCWADASRSDLD